MKILLTGATGFLGSSFLRLAAQQGHEIGGLVRNPTPIPNLRAFSGSLASPPWPELASWRPDTCIHTAWITTPGIYLESRENLRYLAESREFLCRLPTIGVSRVIGIGTCIEYLASAEPLSETSTPIAPKTLYAQCKNELRLALEDAAHRTGFALAWARVFYPYGPGEHPARLCTSILQKLARNEPVLLKTPASRKDYIFIDDLSAALLAVAESGAAGPINLGTGLGASVREIAGRLGALAGKSSLIDEAPGTLVDPLGDIVADASRLKALGWKPSVSLEEGLARLHRSACNPQSS